MLQLYGYGVNEFEAIKWEKNRVQTLVSLCSCVFVTP